MNFSYSDVEETMGVIIVNTQYEKAPGGLKNVDFSQNEVSRIEPLFKKLCKEVKVFKDPSAVDLDDLFEEIILKAQDLKKNVGKD